MPPCGAVTLPHAEVGSRYETRGVRQGSAIQQFMLRLSSKLRRHRWAVFIAWLLLLVPALYLALNQSGNLTGGGFEVAGLSRWPSSMRFRITSPIRVPHPWRWSPRRGPTPRSTT